MLNVELFAKNLLEERKKQNLTQRELSKKSQVSVQMISAYEKGAKLPSLESAINLCVALNVSLDQLCTKSGEKPLPSYAMESLADIVGEIERIQHLLSSFEKSCTITCDESSTTIQIENCGDLAKYFSQRERFMELLKDRAVSEDMVETWKVEALNQLRSKNQETFEMFGF